MNSAERVAEGLTKWLAELEEVIDICERVATSSEKQYIRENARENGDVARATADRIRAILG